MSKRTRRQKQTQQPLMGVGAARLLFEGDEDDLAALIRLGLLRYVWDIRVRMSSARREVRILPESLFEFAEASRKRPRLTKLEWSRVRQLLFGSRQHLTAADLAEVLTCSKPYPCSRKLIVEVNLHTEAT